MLNCLSIQAMNMLIKLQYLLYWILKNITTNCKHIIFLINNKYTVIDIQSIYVPYTCNYIIKYKNLRKRH